MLTTKSVPINKNLDASTAYSLSKILSNKYLELLSKQELSEASIETIVYSVIEYYESIINCMPGNVYWLDKNGVAVGCNKNVLKMFGLNTIAQFKGLTFEEMGVLGKWSKPAVESFKQDTFAVISSGKAKLNIEEPPIPGSDRKPIYFLTNRVPLFDKDNNVIAVVGISIDITTRKEMESALKQAKEAAEIANKAKTEFLENMRHDIRTPLSGIVGVADLLDHETNLANIKEYTAILKHSSQELLELLNDILESIHIANGNIPLAQDKFNLKETLNKVIKLNHSKALTKQLRLELLFDETIPSCLIGDQARIYRIILELLSNALKYTNQGNITISATLVEQNTDDLLVMIDVADTGLGVPQEKQQEIFNSFKRLSPSCQGIHKGSGLGLTNVKKLINDLSGKIFLTSKPEIGSKFTCLIPLKQPAWNEFELAATEETPLVPSTQINPFTVNKNHLIHAGFKILIVEDQVNSALIAKNILLNLGCIVDLANSGKAALDLSSKYKYQMILMDVGLHDMDGCKITQIIKNDLENPNQDTHIIGLTAHSDEALRKRSLKAGMINILNKPITHSLARQIIENYSINPM